MAAIQEPLSIRQLEVFVALVDQQSFTKAAQALGLSQSTVSGHIADLERRLGTMVVERGRRHIRPTAAGEALLAPARATLKAERTTRMAVEELTGLLRGHLVVGGSTIPATYFLPPVMATFHERYPDIALRLVTGDSRDILDRIRDSDVELGVVGVLPDEQTFESHQIGEDRLILILSPTHKLAGKEKVTISEVLAEPMVIREEGSGTREATLESLVGEAAGDPPPALNIVCEVGSTEAVKAAVRAGVGLAFVSDMAVQDELSSGRLATATVEAFDVRRGFHLVMRQGAYLGPAARAFRDAALA
jgi:DNA-binding transcriptional LysR family regulator